MNRIFTNFLVIILSLIFFSCDLMEKNDQSGQEEAKGIEKQFTLGGAPIKVTVRLSAAELALTDFLYLDLETEFSEDVIIINPYLSEEVFYPLLLVENPKEYTSWSKEDNRLITRWRYKLEPMKSGEHTLKPFDIHFRLEKEKSDDPTKWPVYQIHTEEISYRVTSVEVSDEDDIRDIKGLILPRYNYLPVILTASLLVMLSLLTWLAWWYQNRRNKNEIQPLSKFDYYKAALQKLKNLEQKDLINKKEFERLHTELSFILRNYIENFFGLRAEEQTTEEFIKDISNSKYFATEQQMMLHQFLSMADLVKFATFDPGSQNSQEAMQSVRNFIAATGKTDEV